LGTEKGERERNPIRSLTRKKKKKTSKVGFSILGHGKRRGGGVLKEKWSGCGGSHFSEPPKDRNKKRLEGGWDEGNSQP